MLTQYSMHAGMPESFVLAAYTSADPVDVVQVLARSSPTDKFTLVQLLRKQGEVVAVTGDGEHVGS